MVLLTMVSWYHGIKTLTRGVSWWHGAQMKPAKALTIRLSADQADALELVARVQNQPISDIIRSAISDRIEQAKKDPGFKDSLRQRIERAQKLLGDN